MLGRRGCRGARCYSHPVRGRPLALLVAAGMAVSACSGGKPASAPSTTRAPKPAGTLPAPISVQVCSKEAQREMASALGETAEVSASTWVDHRYACTYGYPTSTHAGSFEVAVKELSNWTDTYAYYDALASHLGKSRDLESLGQAAFQATDGSVVVRKDWKVLLVDNTGLPAQFGEPSTSSASVAVTVADVILGCWAGD
jgi:hypothetical protein